MIQTMIRYGVVLVVIASAACGGKVYEIHNGSTKANGVPFYVIAGSCTQETVSLETIYQVSIQVPKTDSTPPIVLMEKPVPASTYRSPEMQQLRKAVTAPTPDLSTISERFEALKPYDPVAKPELVQVSNTTRAETFVDYSRVHYINVNKPGMGSASATAKLNANGTLAETSAEVEDRTAETILGAFPISETVLGILTNAGALGTLMSTEGVDPATRRNCQMLWIGRVS